MVASQMATMGATRVLANLQVTEMGSRQPSLQCIKQLAILPCPREALELKLQLGSDLFLSMSAAKGMKPKNLESKAQTRLCKNISIDIF
jgi:hypothetical protein